MAPVFHEVDGLPKLAQRFLALRPAAHPIYESELVLADDGTRDRSLALAKVLGYRAALGLGWLEALNAVARCETA